MSKEYEYRAYAGACVDLANKATNDNDRKHLLAGVHYFFSRGYCRITNIQFRIVTRCSG